MASPSRSGSVATYRSVAFSAAFFKSSRTFFFNGETTYFGLKFFFGSTPSCDLGRSRTWPIDAFTTNLPFRYFWIVLTLVGDSTMTRPRPVARAAPPLRSTRAGAFTTFSVRFAN